MTHRARLPAVLAFGAIGLLIAGCLSKGESNIVAGGPIGNTACERYCNAILTARCEAMSCLAECKAAREKDPACESFFNAVSNCFAKQTVTCNAAGQPVVPSCETEIQDLKDCEGA